MKKSYVCCICGKKFKGYGNNPYPLIKENGKLCCDDCNIRYVIPERLKLIKSS